LALACGPRPRLSETRFRDRSRRYRRGEALVALHQVAINPGSTSLPVQAYRLAVPSRFRLTEPTRFGWSPDDLVLARGGRCRLPLPQEGFSCGRRPIFEARPRKKKSLGSSAALVIARAVSSDPPEGLMAAGPTSVLEILVEVRDEPGARSRPVAEPTNYWIQ